MGVSFARHRLITLLAWVVFVAVCATTALAGVTGQTLFDRLESSGPSIEGEAAHAADLLQGSDTRVTDSLSLLLNHVDLRSPALAEDLSAATRRLSEISGVNEVINPLAIPPLETGQPNPAAAALYSSDGRGLLLNVVLELDDGELSDDLSSAVVDELNRTAAAVSAEFPDAITEVGGSSLIMKSLIGIAANDLRTGEAISLPIALFVMLIIFGGFLAAGIPLIGSIASILGALGSLFAFSHVMDIDTTVMNVITVIGLGLSIDYGLLIVSRFREEFRRLVAGRPDLEATRRHELMMGAIGVTVNTAGRTVLYSGLIFAIATVGLLVFESPMIRAIAVGAASVVVIAILTALILIPALLGYVGEKLIRPGALSLIPGVGRLLGRFGDISPAEGAFSRLTRWVQRRPVLVSAACLLVLLAVGSPLLTLNITSNAADTIPRSSTQYSYLHELRSDFPNAAAARVQLVSDGTAVEAADWAARVSALDHVSQVTPAREVNGHWTSRVSVDEHTGTQVVRDIRADRPDMPNWVGGQDAASVDFTDSLLNSAPWAALIIAVTAFVLLFLMTGSVVIPIKALVISTLSLGASVGVLVWGFEHGNLAGVLNFNAADVTGVDALVLTLILIFGFGLAMDYEMFLLARIKEHHDLGESTRRAIQTGLQSSGRIITSAALVIVLVFAGFASGELMQIKEIGIALAVTVLLDATLVRMLLVPAVMTALERVLWWAPAWMKRVHARFGLRESGRGVRS